MALDQSLFLNAVVLIHVNSSSNWTCNSMLQSTLLTHCQGLVQTALGVYNAFSLQDYNNRAKAGAGSCIMQLLIRPADLQLPHVSFCRQKVLHQLQPPPGCNWQRIWHFLY